VLLVLRSATGEIPPIALVGYFNFQPCSINGAMDDSAVRRKAWAEFSSNSALELINNWASVEEAAEVNFPLREKLPSCFPHQPGTRQEWVA